MHLGRQLMAAGLLLAVALSAPLRALPAVLPAQAQAASLPGTLGASEAAHAVYLPFQVGGATADLAISAVQMLQGVTQGDSYNVHIAGRPALLRVFVALSGAETLDGVTARLRHYVGGVLQAEVTASPLTVHAISDPGNLTHSFNFDLPASWLVQDGAYVVELDPADAVAEVNETNNRYPAAGEEPFNVIEAPALEVVIVPVTYKGLTPPLDDLSYLTWMPAKVMPVSKISYTVRAAPLVFTGDLRSGGGWSQLLAAVDAIRAVEDPTWNKVYYGLVDSMVADGCAEACYTGLGYVNSAGRAIYKTSVGFAGYAENRDAAGLTFTHEMGHNFGRRHAPCAGPANVDPAYPYASGTIGQWGYDTATRALISPGYKDYMSYCGPEWTSDYTYYGIAQSWDWLTVASGANQTSDALVISGYLAPDGALHVDPAFAAVSPSPAPAASTETIAPTPAAHRHRLVLLDARGGVLASVPFEMSEIILDVTGGEGQGADMHAHAADMGNHAASFRVVVPPVPGLAGLRLYEGDELLYERLAAGPAPKLEGARPALVISPSGEVTLSVATLAAGHYRLRFSPDGGASWHLLAADALTPRVTVSAELLDGARTPLLEVQVSDGVRSDRKVFSVTVP